LRALELFFATASLLAITMVASYIYYRRIKQAQSEYEGSKDLVRSITHGFTQQVMKLLKAIEGIEGDASDARQLASEALKAGRDAVGSVKEGKEESEKLSERFDETEKAIAAMKEEIQELARRPTVAPQQMMVDAPIPLEQNAVLESLTETELEVLTLIEELGEGSVPAIRERINKTREHTARLLKKLFEMGFIDRNTSGMPYRYYIRKEIKELIQRQKERAKLAV